MAFYWWLSFFNACTGLMWAGTCGVRFLDYRHPGSILAGTLGLSSMFTGIWVVNRKPMKEVHGFTILTGTTAMFSLSLFPRFRRWSCWGKFAAPSFYYFGVPQFVFNAYNLNLWLDAGSPQMPAQHATHKPRQLDRWSDRPGRQY